MFSSVIVVFLCAAVTGSQACFSCPTCPQTDLQSDFCRASIVLRARILSGPRQEVTANDKELRQLSTYDPDDVYSVKIVKIFKGKENVTRLPGIQSLGVRNPSLVIDFHTPAQWWKMCIPSLISLERGHEYLLTGYIHEGKLRSSYCDLRHGWASVTHQQRKGLHEEYGNKC